VDINITPNAAPIEAPREIKPEPPPRLTAVVGNIPANLPTAQSTSLAPPPPPAPVRVGGDIQAPKRIFYKDPIYPAIARAAKVQGRVILEATIAKDGSVKDVKILRAVPMLDQAAVEAVSQWKYTPTTLNREPVEVIMTVTVDFALQ
jgi:protein TonB